MTQKDDVYVYLSNTNEIVGITDNKEYAKALVKSKCNVVKLNERLRSKIDLEKLDTDLEVTEIYNNVMSCDEQNIIFGNAFGLLYDMNEFRYYFIELIEPIKSEHIKVILSHINNLYDDYVIGGQWDIGEALDMESICKSILEYLRHG